MDKGPPPDVLGQVLERSRLNGQLYCRTVGAPWGLRFPGRHWNMTELARRAGTSRPTLGRRFAIEVKQSPHAYLTNVRMQEAAHLLSTTEEGLGAIAGHVGYRSEFAFNRAFHRVMGAPPGTYRRSL